LWRPSLQQRGARRAHGRAQELLPGAVGALRVLGAARVGKVAVRVEGAALLEALGRVAAAAGGVGGQGGGHGGGGRGRVHCELLGGCGGQFEMEIV